MFDLNGNMITSGSSTYTYDVENRMVQAAPSGGGTVYYAYDTQNRRVWQWTGGIDQYGTPALYTVYFYGVTGQRLASYTVAMALTTQFVLESQLVQQDTFFGSKRVAATDRLGSSRDWNGTSAGYYPYGEGKGTSWPYDSWKFGTYWRDSATGLDYARNRYYSSTMGRFMTPDPYMSSGGLADPQSWNRFTYVTGDPINFTDRRGLEREGSEGEDPSYCDENPTEPGCSGAIREPGHELPRQIPCAFSGQDLLDYMTKKTAFILKGTVNVTGKEPMLTAVITAEIMTVGAAYDVDPRLIVAVAFVEGKWGAEPGATAAHDSFGLMPGGHLQQFSDWLLSIGAAANTLNNHISNNGQVTTADLYSGYSQEANTKAGNDPLAAYCVGAGCADKVSTLNKVLKGLGGDPSSLTDPCYKGKDGQYYTK